mmetsp:Transcript_124348/g.247952  ORF Transcript_124348/g.247952 Transcript_124348/m.247952 type:complete len:350 (+) Transcript_124348:85-1134(+)
MVSFAGDYAGAALSTNPGRQSVSRPHCFPDRNCGRKFANRGSFSWALQPTSNKIIAATALTVCASTAARHRVAWRGAQAPQKACFLSGNGDGRRWPVVHRKRTTAAAAANADAANDVGVILLSAGVGKRMGAKIPKQYLKLCGLEIALHSLDVFLQCGVGEIVIVCAEEWQSLFEEHVASKGTVQPVIKYTQGGKERQDSVQNGLAQLSTEFAAVHDAARPLVTKDEVDKVIADARKYGAALLAVSTKATIKLAQDGPSGEAVVKTTPDRRTLWEAHTPQVIRADLLSRGFQHAAENNLAVTDDVSLVEFLGETVKLTEGEYTNIKVTTPEDMSVAEAILRSRGNEGTS